MFCIPDNVPGCTVRHVSHFRQGDFTRLLVAISLGVYRIGRLPQITQASMHSERYKFMLTSPLNVLRHLTMSIFEPLQICNDLYTVFLFTKADIVIALIPVVSAIYHLVFISILTPYETLFAVAAAPLSSPIRLIDTTLWIWLHLLQFNVANQIKAPEEDKINKPSRPIPAGRITVHDATILRWALVPTCLACSALYSPQVMWISLPVLLFTTWYNEHDGDKESLSKNFLTAVLYGLSELGGTLVASKCRLTLEYIKAAHDFMKVMITRRSAGLDGSLLK